MSKGRDVFDDQTLLQRGANDRRGSAPKALPQKQRSEGQITVDDKELADF
jgi:hypothetical protein